MDAIEDLHRKSELLGDTNINEEKNNLKAEATQM